MDSKKVQVIFLLVVSFFAAIYLGVSAATAQIEAVAWVAGGLALALCIAMGKKIWMFIPIAVGIPVSLPFLPGDPSIFQLGTAAACVFSMLLLLIRRLPWRLELGLPELALGLLLLSILQAYLRNPVGLNVFGSGNVGGRAYFEVALAVAGTVLLLGTRVGLSELRTVSFGYIFFGILFSLVGVIAFLVPSVSRITGPVFGAWGKIESPDAALAPVDAGAADRKESFRDLGQRLSDWIVCRINPLKSLIHPLWFVVLIAAVGGVMYSGFRSAFAGIVMALVLATAYRSGIKGVFVGTLAGLAGIAVLAVVNVASPLPANIQRALTFLPGTWEKRYKVDAENSTDWRVEMWEAALTTDRYISNKLLGDGLGINARELAAQQSLAAMKVSGASSGWDLHRDYALLVGDYHSGPVHTIRTTGYVGLLVLLIVFAITGWRAHKLLMRVRRTPLFNVYCLFCIPMVWHPFYFVFIFGSFGPDVALLVTHLGMLRLLEHTAAVEIPSLQPAPAVEAPPKWLPQGRTRAPRALT